MFCPACLWPPGGRGALDVCWQLRLYLKYIKSKRKEGDELECLLVHLCLLVLCNFSPCNTRMKQSYSIYLSRKTSREEHFQEDRLIILFILVVKDCFVLRKQAVCVDL